MENKEGKTDKNLNLVMWMQGEADRLYIRVSRKLKKRIKSKGDTVDNYMNDLKRKEYAENFNKIFKANV